MEECRGVVVATLAPYSEGILLESHLNSDIPWFESVFAYAVMSPLNRS
jgi:hypothetical protein